MIYEEHTFKYAAKSSKVLWFAFEHLGELYIN